MWKAKYNSFFKDRVKKSIYDLDMVADFLKNDDYEARQQTRKLQALTSTQKHQINNIGTKIVW